MFVKNISNPCILIPSFDRLVSLAKYTTTKKMKKTKTPKKIILKNKNKTKLIEQALVQG